MPTSFKKLLAKNQPLQIFGVINSYCALLAKEQGAQAIYLSGAGVANSCFGLPDLGLTNLTDVVTEISRITRICNVPLLVDGDTGFGGSLNCAHTVIQVERAGAAALHLEDQDWPKRCGHRDGKKLITADEMVIKIQSAVNARLSRDFCIMARTDALAVEGIDKALERAKLYVEAGADMIFAEAVTKLDEYKLFKEALGDTPILANITEFGKTPMFTLNDLKSAKVDMVLYPLTAFRAMSKAAIDTYRELISTGTQANILTSMQTREELYKTLNYYEYEDKV